VLNEIYDLFIDLDATEEQLDFPVLYTNAKTGTATMDQSGEATDLRPLFESDLRWLRHYGFSPLAPTMLHEGV
jgi:GTP-binding protein